MKNKRIIYFIIAILTVIGISGYAIYNYLADDVIVTVLDANQSMYKVTNIADNYQFALNTDKRFEYSLTDTTGQRVDSDVVQREGKSFIVPKNSFEKNQIYYLDIVSSDVAFSDSRLSDARKIMFYTKGSGETQITLQDNVKKIQQAQLNSSQLVVQNAVLQGDIVETDTNSDGIVEYYQIESVSDDGRVATVKIPDYKQVYKTIHVFKDEKVHFENIKFDRDVAIANLKKTGIFDLISPDVYADDNVGINIDTDEKGNAVLYITYEDDNVEFEYKIGFKISYLTKIYYDDDSSSGGYGMELTVVQGPKIKLDYKTSGDVSGVVSAITEKLKTYKIPAYVPIVPGINLEFSLEPIFSYSGEATLLFDSKDTLNVKFGLFDDKTYGSVELNSQTTAEFDGKVRTDLGLNFYSGISLANIIKVVEAEAYAGVYSTLKGNASFEMKNNSSIENKKGYFEFVLGYKTNGNIKANIIFKTFEHSLWDSSEKELLNISHGVREFQIVDMSDKYALKKDSVAINNINFVYKNLISEQEERYTLSDKRIQDLKVSVDGENMTDIADNTIRGSWGEGKHTIKFEWIFDGQSMTYEKTFEISKQSFVEQYAPVFKDMQSIFNKGVYASNRLSVPLSSWTIEGIQHNVGAVKYAYYDVNDDGVDELLISTSTETIPQYVTALYTLSNNKPIIVGESYAAGSGGSRSFVEAYENGRVLLDTWSAGTGDGQAIVYELSTAGLKKVAQKNYERRNIQLSDVGLGNVAKLDLNKLEWYSIPVEYTLNSSKIDIPAILNKNFASIVGAYKAEDTTSIDTITFFGNGTGAMKNKTSEWPIQFFDFAEEGGMVTFSASDTEKFYIIPAGVPSIYDEYFEDNDRDRMLVVTHLVYKTVFYLD